MTWPTVRLRLPALPLRVTAAVTVLLLAVPLLVLVRMPRPRAEGLGRLLPHAGLLQSFPAAPEREPPFLWRERLDAPTAQLLWRQQRQLWWQFWSHDQAGGAYLVMPLPRQIRVGALAPPPHSLQADGMLVVASGPLALRFLDDQLVQASRRQQGLQQRCLALLEREPAAYWSGQGLEAMAGPIAPLLQALEEGCVALDLVPGDLLFSGEAGLPGADTGAALPVLDDADLPEPIGEGLLLRLSGGSLEPLLVGLLSRREVRETMRSAYGLGDAELALLQGTAFELRLRPQLAGPFQAGLELILPVQGDPAPWVAFLDSLRPRLQARGLVEQPGPQETADFAPALRPATWRDAEGREVGGWRWQEVAGQPPRLQLFLGPAPEPEAPDGPAGIEGEPLPLLRLQARPRALAALNLLPGQLPLPLLQADQLLLLADDASPGPAGASTGPEGATGGVSRLLGRLQLGEPVPIQPPVPMPSAEPPPPSPPPAP